MFDVVPYLFPSLPWFRRLAEKVEEPECAERFRRLGVMDTTFAVQIGDHGYRLVLDGFGLDEVTEWHHDWPVDFVLEGSLADWRELIEHIHERGTADGDHTLNSLVLRGDRIRLSGDDQLQVDNFYRYNASIQALLEVAAKVPTIYRKAPAAA